MSPAIAKKVIIDARMLGETPHGIARYVTRLASGLSRFAPERNYDVQFLVNPQYKANDFFGFSVIPVMAPFPSKAELWEIPRVVRENRATLFHSPSFSSMLSLPCPWVQTLHDLNHLHYGSVTQKIYYRTILKLFAQRAKVLCTVSQFSRSEIAQWLGRPEQSVELAYNALEPEAELQAKTISEILALFGLKNQAYFFCLSNPKPHKNIDFLLKAYGEYRKASGPNALVLALSMKGIEQPGVICLGELGDDQSAALRAGAKAVVFPSLYEGFGLPPLEAALSGTPLIVSKIPPHEEGLQDLKPEEVSWIDPKNSNTLVWALGEAAQGKLSGASPQSRQAILKRFSEEALASTMDRIYRRVLEEKA